MLRVLTRAFVLAIVTQVFPLGVLSQSEAKDLTDVLGRALDFFVPPSREIVTVGASVAPALAATVAQAVAQELPLASVAPAFTYRYNPAVDVFERSTSVPGPLLSERALTLGDKQLNFSVGYSFIDFSKLNGTDLDNIKSPAVQVTFLLNEAVRQPVIPPGFPPLEPGQFLFFTPLFASVGRIRLNLQAHAIAPTLRYGLTDRWDASLAVPIVHTFLRVRSERLPVVDAPAYRFAYVGNAQGLPLGPFHFVDLAGNPIPIGQLQFVKSQRPTTPFKAAGSATGVGDIALRSKYHFWRSPEGGAALGLILRLPSGEKRNFHGTGETHLSIFLYLSQVMWRRVEPHLNIGVDFNADDVDRNSFLYAAGTTLLVGKSLGLVVDFFGRSEFARLPVRFPPAAIQKGNLLNRAPESCTAAQPCLLEPSKEDPTKPRIVSFPFFPEKIKRNDIANFSFGLRWALGESGSIFFGGIVPLNEDGFRADFIPSGGIEYTF